MNNFFASGPARAILCSMVVLSGIASLAVGAEPGL